MRTYTHLVTGFFIIIMSNNSFAQDNSNSCKVELKNLAGKYTGECKNGFAHGKGEAVGQHRYEGSFKFGVPNGKGTYHFNDSTYYVGNFQDGIKEGKGDMFYTRKGNTDSIVKGYWSADIYRGKTYKTYSLIGGQAFDSYDVKASPESGKLITIDISTTSGAPDGTSTSLQGGSGYVLTLTDLVATDGSFIRKTSGYATANRSSITYELSQFPVSLYATLSNGQVLQLELYKAARWTVTLYKNK